MKRLAIVFAVLAIVAAACGSDDDSADTTAAPTTTRAATTQAPTTTAAPTTTTAAPTTTAAAPPDDHGHGEAEAHVTARLAVKYNTAGEFDPAVMGFDVGDVTAEWFSTPDGFFVVVYAGLDLEATGPLCPGNSIQTGPDTYEFVTNAPTPGADCADFPTLTDDPDVGPLICDGVLAYRTAIPIESVGNLLGTIEKPVEGGIMGMTGAAQRIPDELLSIPFEDEFPIVDPATLTC